jgi:hypothetical protein
VDVDGSENRIFDGDASMVARIASLFTTDATIFTNLEFFHATLPYMQGSFWDSNKSAWNAPSDDGNTSEDEDELQARLPICGITSMSLALHDEQGLDMYWMGSFCTMIEQSPSLRFLELRHWSGTDLSNLDELLGEQGTWSATHLSLLECGPITGEVEYVLTMPKDLQSLEIISELTPDTKRHGMDSPVTIQEALGALESVETSLMELRFDPGPSEHWICPESYPRHFNQLREVYQSHAFTSFSKLQRLEAPLEIFSQSTGKMRRDEHHTFYTNFPPSLVELTLVITSREPFHQALERAYALTNSQVVHEHRIVETSDLFCQSCRTNTYEKAHELFKELSQLADHRYLIPALRELHLIGDPCQWLNCEHVQRCTRQLEQAGIAVHVYDRQVEGPTKSASQRWVSEFWTRT